MEPNNKVLVVDDDIEFGETLADILELQGYVAVTAASGLEAIEKLKKENFRCVLMDIKMRGMSGVKVFKKMKQLYPEVKVILMTGYTRDELIKDAWDEGVCDVLYKPFDHKQLLSKIQNVW